MRARSPEQLVGLDGGLAPIAAVLDRVAEATATVLLQGETGTGKEMIAREIHRRSPRCAARFVAVHCAAFADGLLESELFGHEAGAFTGAHRTREGRFETASGGTLFLDEIGDLPTRVQVLLLRVLQDGVFERVGSSTPRRADVRIVAATHCSLEQLVRRGEFREDLFYRLHVIPLWLPPLRERRGDIPGLAQAFLGELSVALGKPLELSEEGLEFLCGEPWPGNVRQLRNVVERSAVLAPPGAVLGARDLRLTTPPEAGQPDGNPALAIKQDAREHAAREILDALRAAQGSTAEAARRLGIPRTTLHDRIRRLGNGPRLVG